MADQKVPTTLAEFAINDNNEAEQAAEEQFSQNEAEEKHPARRMREWRDRVIASKGWENLNGPKLNEWANERRKELLSVTKAELKTHQLKDLTVEKPEQPIDDPEYEERRKKCMADIQESAKMEESFKPKMKDYQKEFKCDKGSKVLHKKIILDTKCEHLKKSNEDRSERIRMVREKKKDEDVEIKEEAGNSPVVDGHQC